MRFKLCLHVSYFWQGLIRPSSPYIWSSCWGWCWVLVINNQIILLWGHRWGADRPSAVCVHLGGGLHWDWVRQPSVVRHLDGYDCFDDADIIFLGGRVDLVQCAAILEMVLWLLPPPLGGFMSGRGRGWGGLIQGESHLKEKILGTMFIVLFEVAITLLSLFKNGSTNFCCLQLSQDFVSCLIEQQMFN